MARGSFRTAWIVGLAVSASACEPIGSSSSSGSQQASAVPRAETRPSLKAPALASAQPSASCVVPMAPAPPERAQPARECPKSPEPAPHMSRGFVSFPDAPGTPRVAVEVAADEAARQRGLMYRTQLAPEEGMLFSWPTDAPRSFWMKNTCLPLDMLFLDSRGFVTGILEQVPVLNEHPRRVACPAAFVLEMNAGWARDRKIQPGQRVTIDYSSE